MTTPSPDPGRPEPTAGGPEPTPVPPSTPDADSPPYAGTQPIPPTSYPPLPPSATTAPGSGAPGYSYGYGYETPQRTADKAVWSLVSAIAGFILCPIVLHIVGLVLANQSLRTIRASGGRVGGDGIASTARILSIIGLVVYGAALVLGLLFLLIALPLGLLTIGSVADDVNRERLTVSPTSITEIDGQAFQHDAGQITYDLSGIDFVDRSADTSIEVGAGELVVEVPADVTVVLDAQVAGGELDVFGDRSDGVGLRTEQTFPGSPSGGSLDLEVDMGVGEVTLERTG